MKILIDENLSFRIAARLADLFPDLLHADALGLGAQPDSNIWTYATDHGFLAILTADIDFQNRVLELGQPPKVIRIERCELSTAELVSLIRREAVRITDFLSSPNPLLVLRR